MADQDWEAAQAALEAARQLPVGAERAEALKKAGKLRYDADKNRPLPPDRNQAAVRFRTVKGRR